MKIDPDDFRVRPGEKPKLKKWPTRVKPYYDSEDQYRKRLAEHVERLSSLQSLLYASDRYALLVIFQAMDAAGKDGVIKHVMSGVNPQGCQVSSFKHPSAEELDHDFLWRTTRFLPERGRIDDPHKNWKFSLDDVEERKYWKQYMKAYEACLAETSSKHAPWYVVPADDKPNARLIVSRVIVDALEELDMSYPKPDAARRRELQAIRRRLVK